MNTLEKNEKLAFTIRLEGKIYNIFKQTKEETGIQSNAEVMRYIVTQYNRMRRKA